MAKPPAPLRPLAVSIVVERLKIVLPLAAVAIIAAALAPGAVMLLARPLVPQAAAAHEVATDGEVLFTMSRAVLNGLPVLENQKRAADCDPDRAQVVIDGGCWVKTDKPPPCPKGKLWEHEGKCWFPVAYGKPVPTTGEIRPGNVAGEP